MATHRDLEFAVNDVAGNQRTFRNFDKAAGFAISVGASRGEATIDVLAWSRAAAVAWSGDEGGEEYDADPEASVFDRIEIKVNPTGKVA